MKFEYTATFYVSEESIEEMLDYCKKGYSYERAIHLAASCWDDDRYYAIEDIIPQLALELERRLDAE